MSRQEKYKQRRVLRRKIELTLFLCLAILAAGFCAVDYSTNMLVHNKAGLDIFTARDYGTRIELSFLNERIYINTQYLNRDMERIRKLFGL